MKDISPSGCKVSTSCDLPVELMKTFGHRRPLMYSSAFHETVKLLRASPGIAVVSIGTAALLLAGCLMLLFVALLG
jgi:hypothetical protein